MITRRATLAAAALLLPTATEATEVSKEFSSEFVAHALEQIAAAIRLKDVLVIRADNSPASNVEGRRLLTLEFQVLKRT